jgi:hypothetical protein
MASKLSVAEVIANLEKRAAFHREQEAFHAQKESEHGEQRASHAAELEKVLHSLEAFRTAAPAAVELAQSSPVQSVAAPAVDVPAVDETISPSGRLMISRLLRQIVQSPSFPEPFGPTSLTAEVNRLFPDRLRRPVDPRTASDVLRRMRADGEIQLAREGKAFQESLYTRRSRG